MNIDYVRNGFSSLTKQLISKNLTITTMESATSGQIASLITDTEGASAIFKGAFITYSNEAKIMQGVDESIIQKYSVYSEETARAMACACKSAYKANIGIGVTGTMGNIDPANIDNSEPGVVYFAIAYNSALYSWREEIEPQSTRLDYKMAVAELILNQLTRLLES